MISDFRIALRGLRRVPGLVATAVLTIGLGAGANIAIFSVLDATLLRPLPYRDPARVAVIWEANPKMEGFVAERLPVAGRNFVEWKVRLHSFSQMEALQRCSETLTGMGRPEDVTVARITPGLFSLFGREAILGRTFQPTKGEPGRNGIAVLSAAFFAQKLHGDRRELGRKLILNGVPYSVVGVMPADFHLPALWQGREEIRPDIWLPAPDDVEASSAGVTRRNYVFARLRDGVSMAQARRELSETARQLEREYPRLDAGFGANAFSIVEEDVSPATRRAVLALQGAVWFVLLIACANVANLLLVRASGRAGDTAICAALGASRARIARLAIAESLLMGGAGGVLGVGLARALITAIDFFAPESAYHLHELALDWRVLTFALVSILFSALVCGVAPAVAAASVDLRGALSQNVRSGSGRGAQRIRGVLVAAETALALILLTGAGLMIRGMVNLSRVDPGFNPAHVLTMRVHRPDARCRNERQVREFSQRLLADVSTLPGVQSVAISTSLPLGDALALTPYRLAGEPEPRPAERTMADFKGVSEDYFRTTGSVLLRGRVFAARDAMADSPQVVIINEALAKRLERVGDPLGRALVVGTGPKTIIGVVAGARQTGLDSAVRPEMFLPTRTISSMALVLRTAGDPMAAAQRVTNAVWAIDPEQPVANVRTLEDQIFRSGAERRFETALFAGFALLALSLAALGIYGVLSHSIAMRTREIGVRLALGAQPSSVRWLVLRGALRLTLAGILAGGAGALALTRCMAGTVFGVSASDTTTLAAAIASLLATAILAAYMPGARAARLNPTAALRRE